MITRDVNNNNNKYTEIVAFAKSWHLISFVACWQDGVHVARKAKEEVEMTEEQKKVMRTQDIKYVEMKRVSEAKVSSFFC